MSVYPSEGGPYAQPIAYRQPVQSKTNGMAVASLVLGILWIGGLGSVLAGSCLLSPATTSLILYTRWIR